MPEPPEPVMKTRKFSLGVAGKIGLDRLQHLQRLFRLLGFMALVVLPEDLVGVAVNDDNLHGGRADVHAHPQQLVLFSGFAFSVSPAM